MKWLRVNLANISGGSGRRAASILVAAHLAPGLVALGLWALGLLPVFDDLRWIPVTVATTFGVVSTVGLMLAFGMWGTARSFGRSFGEEYEKTFSRGVGYALGWLRWLLQLVMVFVVLIPVMMTWVNVRWWQVVGTDELEALPDRAAAIPVMPDWERTDVSSSETGVLPSLSSTIDGPEPEGFVEQRFTVPDSFTFSDLTTWLGAPEWTEPTEGEAFGALQVEHCTTDSGYCDARLVPPEGEHPEYFIRARFREPANQHGEPEVEIRLTYRQFVPPDYEVSQETVERAQGIPVPVDWLPIRTTAAETINGETFSQHYRVPEAFDRDALEAWLRGTEWTAPASGEPFGQIEVDSCRESDATKPRTYLCSAMVVGTERVPGESPAGPVESLRASLRADHTVRVTLERNG